MGHPSTLLRTPSTTFSLFSQAAHCVQLATRALILKIHKEGSATQHITLTDRPLQQISVNGKRPAGSATESKHAEWDDDGKPQTGSTATTRTVTFVSDPNRAEIYVDKKFVGQAPATISIQPGSHVVVMKASGRKDWQRDLDDLKNSRWRYIQCSKSNAEIAG